MWSACELIIKVLGLEYSDDLKLVIKTNMKKCDDNAILERKRVNTSLEQLRSLLPFSTNMKRDMASMLEQAVEYINTMHTVLNQEEPACLSKVYEMYQIKVEETNGLRKSVSRSKKKGSPSCYSGPTTPQPAQYPAGFMPNMMQPEPSFEPDVKRRRSSGTTVMFGTPGSSQVPQNILPPLNCPTPAPQYQNHISQHFMEQANGPGPSGYPYYPYGFMNPSTGRPGPFYNGPSNMQGNMFVKPPDGMCHPRNNSPYAKIDNLPKPSLMGHQNSISPIQRNVDYMQIDMNASQFGRNSATAADMNANYIGMIAQHHQNNCNDSSPNDEKIKLKMSTEQNDFRNNGNNRKEQSRGLAMQNEEYQNHCGPSHNNYVPTSISKQPITPIFNSNKFSNNPNAVMMNNTGMIQPSDANNNSTQIYTSSNPSIVIKSKSENSPHNLDVNEKSEDETSSQSQIIGTQNACDLTTSSMCHGLKWQQSHDQSSSPSSEGTELSNLANETFAQAVQGKIPFSFDSSKNITETESATAEK